MFNIVIMTFFVLCSGNLFALDSDILHQANKTSILLEKETEIKSKFDIIQKLYTFIEEEYSKIDSSSFVKSDKQKARAFSLAIFSEFLSIITLWNFKESECDEIYNKILIDSAPRKEGRPKLKDTAEEVFWTFSYLADICSKSEYIPN